MANSKAALVSTDPPYLVDYTGERPKHGARDSGKDWSATYKEVEIQDAERFFTGVFSNVLRVIAPNAAIYCWHAHRRCGLIQRIWGELGILDHQQIIWVKPASVFGRVFWHFRHEPCMMGWVKGSQPEHATGNNRSAHEYNSVWEIAWESNAGTTEAGAHSARGGGSCADGGADAENGDSESAAGGKARPGNNEHPTQKPVEIFARPMRRHTKRGDLCFEPFSGSGTQIIAAEQLQRRCAAIELEPVFVDVAIRRWQNLTGKHAVLVGAATDAGKPIGHDPAVMKTWQDLAKERGVDVPVDERLTSLTSAAPKQGASRKQSPRASADRTARRNTVKGNESSRRPAPAPAPGPAGAKPHHVPEPSDAHTQGSRAPSARGKPAASFGAAANGAARTAKRNSVGKAARVRNTKSSAKTKRGR